MNTDKYTSLVCLKRHLRQDVDYRIRIVDRNAAVTIISPHGGFIEPGTSAIARSIAAASYNLFDFQGLRRENAQELHVTATRFRDPELAVLLKRSIAAVSVHGMGNQGHTQIWLGGRNLELKALMLERLSNAGFEVNPDSPRYRGESPANVVNLARSQGVQLELSYELLELLFRSARFYANGRCPRTTERFKQLVRAVRSAIIEYEAARCALHTAGCSHE